MTYGAPRYLRSDNGPQFIARTLKAFAEKHAVTTAYIDPGKPWQNSKHKHRPPATAYPLAKAA